MRNIITQIEKDSIAEELGIAPGDVLLAINDSPVVDVFDYRYMIQDTYLEALIQKPDKTQLIYEIEKDETEDLGLIFETGLLDQAKHCTNKCIFCFIDQLPPGMRDTLYFKDDDSRLSFLQGNYVTLTNMTARDIDRIIFYHLSPINISVHATDPQLRASMLKNQKAAHITPMLDKLYEAGIEMNFQIVLCKGVNDGKNLDVTIRDLSAYIPRARSLSVVPVGLTRFREKLFPLEPFTKADASHIIKQLKQWQTALKKQHHTAFVYAADEFYLKAEQKIPLYAHYEGFPQIENGVGMLAAFERELNTALKKLDGSARPKKVSIVTGEAAFDFMCAQMEKIKQKLPNIDCRVYAVKNNFFGPEITVSGLLTGNDILSQLQCKDLGDMLLIPQNALRAQDTVLLDDMDIDTLTERLNVDVFAVQAEGRSLLERLITP